MKRCKACNNLHKENLGITNDSGFFCSFLHAFNAARGREPESSLSYHADRFGNIGHGRPIMTKQARRRRRIELMSQNSNRKN